MTVADGVIGFTASAAAITLTHPIDVFKANYQVLQNSGTKIPVTGISTLRHIYRTSGLLGFAKGLPASLTSQPVFWSVFYQAKSLDLKILQNKIHNDILNNIVCGSAGSFVANPFFVLRTRFQVRENTDTYLRMAKNIYKNEGISKFFSGYPSSVLNNLKLGLQFPLYELLKSNNVNIFYSAGIAKFIATSVFYPLDIVRTLQRNNPQKISIISSFKIIYKNGGIMGFYKGVMIYNLYSTPNFIILMYLTDFLKNQLNKF